MLNENDFDKLDMSIRGKMPKGIFKQITITFNPWNSKHWLNKRFFYGIINGKSKHIRADVNELETKGKFIHKQTSDQFVMTTNHKVNEFLDSEDIRLFGEMKERNPQKYLVAGLGIWGVAEGLIFENWEERFFDWEQIIKTHNVENRVGLDFGFTNDPTAIISSLFDFKNKICWIFDEIYDKGMSNEKIFESHQRRYWKREQVFADQAEPKSIARLKMLGMRVTAAAKGKDSINFGIDYLQEFKVFVHPRCSNMITELSNYAWKEDKTGKKMNEPIDDFNHAIDALRYSVSNIYMKKNGINGKIIGSKRR